MRPPSSFPHFHFSRALIRLLSLQHLLIAAVSPAHPFRLSASKFGFYFSTDKEKG